MRTLHCGALRVIHTALTALSNTFPLYNSDAYFCIMGDLLLSARSCAVEHVSAT